MALCEWSVRIVCYQLQTYQLLIKKNSYCLPGTDSPDKSLIFSVSGTLGDFTEKSNTKDRQISCQSSRPTRFHFTALGYTSVGLQTGYMQRQSQQAG